MTKTRTTCRRLLFFAVAAFVMLHASIASAIVLNGDIVIDPAPGESTIKANRANDFRIAFSTLPSDFSGVLEIQCSDTSSPLDGMYLRYESGWAELEGLAWFTDTGSVTITASDVANSEHYLSATITVNAGEELPPEATYASPFAINYYHPANYFYDFLESSEAVRIRFNNPVDASTLAGITATPWGGSPLSINTSVTSDGRWVMITPAGGSWHPGVPNGVFDVVVPTTVSDTNPDGAENLASTVTITCLTGPTSFGHSASPAGTFSALGHLEVDSFFTIDTEDAVCPRCGQRHAPPTGIFASTPDNPSPSDNRKNPPQPRVDPRGDFTTYQRLISWTGRIEEHEFIVSYRSNGSGATPFGHDWTFNFDVWFTPDPSVTGGLIFHAADGRAFPYTKIAGVDGQWEGPEYLRHKVYMEADTLYLRTLQGRRYAFEELTAGKWTLYAIYDNHGNTITFGRSHTYPTWGRLLSLTDELGRTINFTYGTGDFVDQIISFTDWDSRTWTFDYEKSGAKILLKKVHSPATDWIAENGSTNSNTVRTVEYSYTSDLMTEIKNARGHTTTTATYDSGDRVNSIQYGNALRQFSYPPETDSYMHAFDPSGSVLRLEFDSAGIPIEATVSRGGSTDTREIVFNSAKEVVKRIYPLGNTVKLIRDGNGNIVQEIRESHQSGEPDLITVRTYETTFNRVTSLIEPRGNTSTIVTFPNGEDENEVNGTPRTITVQTGQQAQRDAYTTFYVYDYEDYTNSSQMGGRAGQFAGSFPYSYGRTTSGASPDSGIFVDQDNDGVIDIGGMMVACKMPSPLVVNSSTPSSFASSRQDIETFQSYNQYGQTTMVKDPVGTITRNVFYAEPWHTTTAPNGGYLKDTISDTSLTSNDVNHTTGVWSGTESGSTLALVSTMTYTKWGDLTSITDGRGNTWSFEINALGLMTKSTAPSPFSYERRFYHDGNMNIAKIEIDNEVADDTDDDGVQDDGNEQATASHSVITHRWTYYPDDNVKEFIEDAATPSNNTLTNTTRYNYNDDLMLEEIIWPQGNKTRFEYEYRDLLAKRIHGFGGTAPMTTTYAYDANANRTGVTNGNSHTTTFSYDGHDRRTKVTDANGNEVQYTLNAAGLVTSSKIVEDASGSPTTLQQRFLAYDEMGRVFQSAVDHFDDSGSGLTGGTQSGPVSFSGAVGNLSTSLTVFDARSLATHSIDPHGNVSTTSFDALGRLVTTTLPNSSAVTFTYDKGGNVIRTATVESGTTYYEERFYDELNRVILHATNMKNATRYLYDSRGNVIQASDSETTATTSLSSVPTASEHGTFPQGASGLTGRGNTTRFTYDSLSKVVEVARDLRTSGLGNNSVSNTITTKAFYDGNERLAGEIDSNGAVTFYEYDDAGRRTLTRFADGTTTSATYDAAGNMLTLTDPRSVTKTWTYDDLERATDETITNTGLSGPNLTTFRAWEYDGLSRVTRAEDNDSIVTRTFSSFDQILSESQSIGSANRTAKTQTLTGTTRSVNYAYDGKARRTQMQYPALSSSDYRLNYSYDSHDRLTRIGEQNGSSGPDTAVATWSYLGAGDRRSSRTIYSSSAHVVTNLTYDADRRVLTRGSEDDSSNIVTSYSYGWSKGGRRRYERDNVEKLASYYHYDSVGRLVTHRAGIEDNLDSALGNNTAGADPGYSAVDVVQWTLDKANNWLERTTNGNDEAYKRFNDDINLNQISSSPNGDHNYDAVGNFTHYTSGVSYKWDADNRVLRFSDGSDDFDYRYDALGRRISKLCQGYEILYWYDGASVIEESIVFKSTLVDYAKNIEGARIDEHLRRDTFSIAESLRGATTSGSYFYHSNSIGSVTALTEDDGSVIERYSYSAYGEITVLDDGYSEVTGGTQYDNPFGFAGRRLEIAEGTGNWYMRARTYDPSLGRFLSRDPIGIWGDPGNIGNGQAYCGNDPINHTDPTGLKFVNGDGEDLFGPDDPKGSKGGFKDFDKTVIEHLKKIEKSLESAVKKLLAEIEKAKQTLAERKKQPISEDLCGHAAEKLNSKAVINHIISTIASLTQKLKEARAAVERFKNAKESKIEIVIVRRGKNRWDHKEKKVQFDPGDTESAGQKRPPWSGLAHEISHAMDQMIDGDSPSKMATPVPPHERNEYGAPGVSERDAVDFENIARYGAGVPRRTSYDKH